MFKLREILLTTLDSSSQAPQPAFIILMVAVPVTTGTANIFIENTNTTNIIYIYLDTVSTSGAIMSLFVNTIRDIPSH